MTILESIENGAKGAYHSSVQWLGRVFGSSTPSSGASEGWLHTIVMIPVAFFIIVWELVILAFEALIGLLVLALAVALVGILIALISLGIHWLLGFRQTGFQGDIDLGLSSETFDLGENVSSNDTRAGLSTLSKLHILALMVLYRESFDAARARYVRLSFHRNNIGPDGTPLDPKAVTFSEV